MSQGAMTGQVILPLPEMRAPGAIMHQATLRLLLTEAVLHQVETTVHPEVAGQIIQVLREEGGNLRITPFCVYLADCRTDLAVLQHNKSKQHET